jgi:hypothetical protein
MAHHGEVSWVLWGSEAGPGSESMARHYTSFLMRLWLLDGGERRIQIEHIQSGASAQVITLADALAWIDVQCADGIAGVAFAEPMWPPDETSLQETLRVSADFSPHDVPCAGTSVPRVPTTNPDETPRIPLPHRAMPSRREPSRHRRRHLARKRRMQ